MSRIAIIDLLFNWPPDGGARTDVKEMAERLSEEHEVCLFIPSFLYGFSRGKIQDRLNLKIKKIRFNIFTFNFLQVPYRFKKEIDKFKPDFIFIADGWYLKPYLVLALKRYSPVLRFYAYETICIRSHGHLCLSNQICDVDYLQGNLICVLRCAACSINWLVKTRDKKFIHEFIAALVFLPFYRNIVKRAIKYSGKVIVYNETIRNKIKDINKNILTIPSGVDAKLFNCPKRYSGSEFKVLMAGRIDDPLKGFSTLYKACQLLREKRKDFKLLLTTASEFREDYICSVGWLNQENLAKLYKEVDICVVPSIWPEPFGIVALEAMAAGKPVIVTSVGGLKNIVIDGESGIMIQPGDYIALKEKLALLFDNPKIRNNLGNRGRERIMAYFTWDHIYKNFYSNLFSLF
jgi:glycosyltransferase involved in cell wall biosynthesis